MNQNLLSTLTHEGRNLSVVIEGIVRRIVVLQEMPVKNRDEVDELLVKLQHRIVEFNKFTEKFKQECDCEGCDDTKRNDNNSLSYS